MRADPELGLLLLKIRWQDLSKRVFYLAAVRGLELGDLVKFSYILVYIGPMALLGGEIIELRSCAS